MNEEIETIKTKIDKYIKKSENIYIEGKKGRQTHTDRHVDRQIDREREIGERINIAQDEMNETKATKESPINAK